MEDKFSFKKIFKNSMWQITEKILTMLISVLTTSIIARYMGVSNYGTLNYIVSIVMLFTAFSTLGMEKITINDIINKKFEKRNIIGTSFVIRLIGAIVLIILSQITIYILTDGDKTSQILGIIVSSCMILKAFEVIEYYLQAQMQLKVVSIIRFITAIVVAIAKISVAFFDLGIIGYASTYLLDATIVAVLLYIYYRNTNREKLKFDKSYAKTLLKRCWYIAIAGLMTTIYMRIDQIMLGSMLIDKTENGIYSAATKIAEMWYFVPLAVIASFQPVIVKRKSEKDEKLYHKEMQRLYDIIAIIGILCGIVITLFGWIPINILYGSEYARASEVLCISVWAGLFATLGSARSVWLVAEGKQKYTLIYTLTGCIVNITLNSILIPKLGAYGAAIATLIAQCITNVFSLMPFKATRESSVMILKGIFLNNTLLQVMKRVKDKIIK